MLAALTHAESTSAPALIAHSLSHLESLAIYSQSHWTVRSRYSPTGRSSPAMHQYSQSTPAAEARPLRSVDRTPRQTSSSVTRSEHDAGQPPGHVKRKSISALDDVKSGPAAALGFSDLLPAPRPSTARPQPQRRETSSGSLPYSSWSSAPSTARPDVRHGASKVYTFMPSTSRTPIPPPLRSPAGSPVSEVPPMSKDMHRRISSASSVTTSPSGMTYHTLSSDSGVSYFSSSRRPSADDASSGGVTTPPPSTPGSVKEVPFSPADDGAMSAYEPRRLAESDLQHASIGRTVDEALSALLGATKLVQAGLGSAALIIGPIEGSTSRHAIDRGQDGDRDPTRRPSPPPSHAARGEHFKPPSGLITVNPRAMSDRNARRLINDVSNSKPRAIKAICVPPVRVVRPPQPQ